MITRSFSRWFLSYRACKMDMKIYFSSEMLWKILDSIHIHILSTFHFQVIHTFKQTFIRILVQVINEYVEQSQARDGC